MSLSVYYNMYTYHVVVVDYYLVWNPPNEIGKNG